jgi:hypothetical protein
MLHRETGYLCQVRRQNSQHVASCNPFLSGWRSHPAKREQKLPFYLASQAKREQKPLFLLLRKQKENKNSLFYIGSGRPAHFPFSLGSKDPSKKRTKRDIRPGVKRTKNLNIFIQKDLCMN